MPSTLAHRLSAARQSRFVGREGERQLFETALASDELPFNLIYLFGPGGVGKTALLAEFTRLCSESAVPLAALDGRNLDPSPDTFTNALTAAFNLTASQPLAAQLGDERHVILIDTYELLTPLDNWLREIFLPTLPETILTVIAARNPPAEAWRSDTGWQSVLRVLPLRNLAPHETLAFLTNRSIPAEQHAAVAEFTHGHPLALSLVADEFAQRPGAQRAFQPESSPDIIKALVERFVQKVPSPAHRAALEACALVRLTTEPLLTEMIPMLDAHELFNWLCGLSFVELGPNGLFLHDLARDALTADLRWRNPDWYSELHKRARGYYAANIQKTSAATQQRIMFDYIFLHRESPLVRPFIDWQTGGSLITDSLREHDRGPILAMAELYEGDHAAQLAAYWMSKQPQGFLVFRDSDQQPTGFMAILNLGSLEASELELDPAAQAAKNFLEANAPLRSGETASLFRFWMSRDSYQAVSPVQSLVFINAVLHYLTTPGLVYTFFPCAEPDFWAPLFAYADLARLPKAGYSLDGRSFGVYGHNWRAVPPTQWLGVLAERETGKGVDAPRPVVHEAIVVLSEPGFADAVRDALQHYPRPDGLTQNPLLQSRLVIETCGASASRAERAATLQKLIQTAAQQLQSSPRELKFYKALHATYLQPAETQEQAAELLDLPFSTYRRHLKSGIDRVVEILWQRELHGL